MVAKACLYTNTSIMIATIFTIIKAKVILALNNGDLSLVRNSDNSLQITIYQKLISKLI